MNDTEKRELAKKLMVFYDTMLSVWSRLKAEDKISKEEENLMWATHAAWRTVMGDLGEWTGDDINKLRGDGEWPKPKGPYDWDMINAMK